jgi:hypothetical protein
MAWAGSLLIQTYPGQLTGVISRMGSKFTVKFIWQKVSTQEEETKLEGSNSVLIGVSMEESREQCTVVLASIFTQLARGWVKGRANTRHSFSTYSLASSVTINAKTTVHCSPDSSMRVRNVLSGRMRKTYGAPTRLFMASPLPSPSQLQYKVSSAPKGTCFKRKDEHYLIFI